MQQTVADPYNEREHYLYTVIMCCIKIKICTTCLIQRQSSFILCQNGMAGNICLGPGLDTSSDITVSTSIIKKVAVMHIASLIKTETISVICTSCLRARHLHKSVTITESKDE